MASRPRITAARVLAGIACAMRPARRLAGVGARTSNALPLESRRHPHRPPRRGPGRGHRPLPSPRRRQRACPRRPRRRRSPEPLARDARPLARERPAPASGRRMRSRRSSAPRVSSGPSETTTCRSTPRRRTTPLFAADSGPGEHRPAVQALRARPTPTSTRPRPGIRRPASTWSSASSTPASTSRIPTWPRTSGPIPGEIGGGSDSMGRRRRQRLRRRLAGLGLGTTTTTRRTTAGPRHARRGHDRRAREQRPGHRRRELERQSWRCAWSNT